MHCVSTNDYFCRTIMPIIVYVFGTKGIYFVSMQFKLDRHFFHKCTHIKTCYSTFSLEISHSFCFLLNEYLYIMEFIFLHQNLKYFLISYSRYVSKYEYDFHLALEFQKLLVPPMVHALWVKSFVESETEKWQFFFVFLKKPLTNDHGMVLEFKYLLWCCLPNHRIVAFPYKWPFMPI